MRNKIAGILIICMLAGCLLSGCKGDENIKDSSSKKETMTEKSEPQGLFFEGGKLMQGDKEFYGVGVNYYDMFTGCFYKKWDLTDTMNALEVLDSYGCKVVRFATLPFYGEDMGYYLNVEDTYWSKLDQLVEKCEELGIGLIPSLFWRLSFFDYYGEVYEESIFNDESQGMKFMRDYTEKFVKRYAHSPAIYGWEFSNERILSSDIPGRQLEDVYYTLNGVNRLYTVFSEIVAENDPYNRMIATGDTMPRASQYNQWKYGNWTGDTMDQHLQVLEKMHPLKMNSMSLHAYSLRSLLSPKDQVGAYFEADTWKELFEHMQNVSSTLSKACYVGECGYALNADMDFNSVTQEDLQECYDAIVDAAYDTDMQLILLWNYDPTSTLEGDVLYGRGSGVEYSWNENMPWGQIALESMKKLNDKWDSK